MPLTATNLGKLYNGGPVVSNVGLPLEPRQILGLMGASGSGNSNVLNMLSGVIPATHGQVHLEGRDISALSLSSRARLGLGYLPHSTNLFLDQSVQTNLRLTLEVYGWSTPKIEDRIDELCAQFSLNPLRDITLGTLSGGQRKIIEIAFALAPQPQFLLLDDPFTKFDPKTVAFLLEQIRTLASSGVGILISSPKAPRRISPTIIMCAVRSLVYDT